MHELASVIESKRPDLLSDYEVQNNELTVQVKPNKFVELIDFLLADNDCQFTTLIDITAVDYIELQERFKVVYHLLSMKQNQRIRVILKVTDEELVPSITGIHPSANWYEREVYDMYGIVFSDHPDLRRLLTDYGFSGHPLRKDFPTTGYTEVRYDEEKKQVVYEPTKLNQEYRQFDFLSPWEGARLVEKTAKTDNEA